jgi:hypothetical protein
MNEVIVDRDFPRDYICVTGHVWTVPGETTWNPWGSPDWRPKAGVALDCPTCGKPGSRAMRCTPDMTAIL